MSQGTCCFSKLLSTQHESRTKTARISHQTVVGCTMTYRSQLSCTILETECTMQTTHDLKAKQFETSYLCNSQISVLPLLSTTFPLIQFLNASTTSPSSRASELPSSNLSCTIPTHKTLQFVFSTVIPFVHPLTYRSSFKPRQATNTYPTAPHDRTPASLYLSN